jgi:hypothetical protein
MEGKCDLCDGPGAGAREEDKSCHDQQWTSVEEVVLLRIRFEY